MKGKPIKLCERCKYPARVRTWRDREGWRCRYAVRCDTCGNTGPMAETREQAIELWNELECEQCVS